MLPVVALRVVIVPMPFVIKLVTIPVTMLPFVTLIFVMVPIPEALIFATVNRVELKTSVPLIS